MSSKHDTIDLGLEVHDWQGATELASLIGLSGSNAGTQVSTAASTGYRCNDYAIERRMICAEERDEHPRGKWLYRVRPEGVKRNGVPQTDKAPAEGAEPEITELLEENAKLRAQIADAKKTISRYQHAPGPPDDTELRRQIEKLTAERDEALGLNQELQGQLVGLEADLRLQLHEPGTLGTLGLLEDAAWDILTGEVCVSKAKQHLARVLRSLR